MDTNLIQWNCLELLTRSEHFLNAYDICAAIHVLNAMVAAPVLHKIV